MQYEIKELSSYAASILVEPKHACGINEWEILRVGMDFRLKCVGCGRQVMVPRKMVEKNFRGFIKKACQD